MFKIMILYSDQDEQPFASECFVQYRVEEENFV